MGGDPKAAKNELPEGAKAVITVLVFLAIVIALIVQSCGGDDNGGGSGGVDAEDEPERAPAQVTYVQDGSYCNHDVLSGKVDFVVRLRNEEARTVEVEILPVRYYSDGERNASPLDEMFDELEPGEERGVFHPFDIQPDHTVVRCEARIEVEGETELVEVPVGR